MLAIAKEFENEIISKFSRKTEASKPLKLDLPPQIRPDKKLFPVRIVNDDFAAIGLTADTIAIGSYSLKLRRSRKAE